MNDQELLAALPNAARLVLPLSPILPPKAQETIIRWFQKRNDRQLWLGPDTALLDGDGNWLARDNRPLWSWLQVEPGARVDIATTLEVDGETHRRFRVFNTTKSVNVLSSGAWQGKPVPARVECLPGVILHAYDWSLSSSSSVGANAIPLQCG